MIENKSRTNRELEALEKYYEQLIKEYTRQKLINTKLQEIVKNLKGNDIINK